MAAERSSSFSYIGARGYVHSTDLIAEAANLVAVGGVSPALTLRSFKIFREITTDGHWHSGAKPTSPAASLRFVDPEGADIRLHFVDDGESVTQRRPDEPLYASSITLTDRFQGRATLDAPETASSLFKALVDLNKALHVKTLVGEGGDRRPYRFVYLEDMPWHSLTPGAQISVGHLGVRQRDGHTFSLNTFSMESWPAPAKMCFSF